LSLRLAMAAAALLLFSSGARAATPPVSCVLAALPALASAPAIAVWSEKELMQVNWHPPSCTGWAASSRSKVLVSLAASLRSNGAMSGLLTRLGAISALPGVRYWSTTDQKWGPLSKDASALTGPDPLSRRRDFSAAEFGKGAALYYWEDDVRTGSTVYRLKVLESTPEQVVVSSENVTPMRSFFLTVFKPGALQTVLIIQQASPGVFGVGILTRSGEGASMLAAGHDKSFVNRAAAIYRQLAGIKTDQEPPAAP
jgi:hypothetical protein